jgi:hypothetical protein
LAVGLGLTLCLSKALREFFVRQRGPLAEILWSLHRDASVAGPDALQVWIAPWGFRRDKSLWGLRQNGNGKDEYECKAIDHVGDLIDNAAILT